MNAMTTSSAAARSAHESGVFRIVANAEAWDTDEALVAALIEGNAQAWREFQERYGRLIQRCVGKVARRFSRLISDDDVMEITSVLYVSLLSNDKHKLRAFDPSRGNRLSSWIGMLAVNCTYDHLRVVKREPHKECIFEAVDIASDSKNPYELTCEAEEARIAADTLAEFSERDQAFAALYFGEGMDPSLIADRMNISVKTVYSKKHKIQSRLEAVLRVA
jgi:RNA polymerase sigma-70 factor, ECF subfamily